MFSPYKTQIFSRNSHLFPRREGPVVDQIKIVKTKTENRVNSLTIIAKSKNKKIDHTTQISYN